LKNKKTVNISLKVYLLPFPRMTEDCEKSIQLSKINSILTIGRTAYIILCGRFLIYLNTFNIPSLGNDTLSLFRENVCQSEALHCIRRSDKSLALSSCVSSYFGLLDFFLCIHTYWTLYILDKSWILNIRCFQPR